MRIGRASSGRSRSSGPRRRLCSLSCPAAFRIEGGDRDLEVVCAVGLS
jgi:hypothetical protein